MQNFDYVTPTRLIFGKGVVEQLPEVMRQYGKRILLTYGGGSIKKIGLYDKVKTLLSDFEIVELSGIQPNPKYDPSVLDGVKLCKEHDVDAILSVGGGSVLDCSKAIAAGAKYDGDPLLYPAVSFLDPTYTFTVSRKQTAAGCADAMNHIMEQYFCEDSTLLNDGFMEAALKSLMVNAKKCLENPKDYTARAEMMLDCTYGCNGIYSLGNSESGWPCHGMEHALSAYYDITHGEGLAIITPRWMKHILSDKTVSRFVKYGVNVFGIDPDLDRFDIANRAIEETYQFFASIGIPMHLKEVGIDESRIDEMAHHVAENEGLENACGFLCGMAESLGCV